MYLELARKNSFLLARSAPYLGRQSKDPYRTSSDDVLPYMVAAPGTATGIRIAFYAERHRVVGRKWCARRSRATEVGSSCRHHQRELGSMVFDIDRKSEREFLTITVTGE